MANHRRNYSAAEELALTTQVGGFCPLCGKYLFIRKKSREFKSYEIAHIYPLNPKKDEVELLSGVERLSHDPNSLDNLIPLCTGCHDPFDTPRTVEEYEKLAGIKKKLIQKTAQRVLSRQYPLENDIDAIVARLSTLSLEEEQFEVEVSYDPKSIDGKLDSTMPGTTRRRIKHAVGDYYQYIRREFRNLEQQSPHASQLIYSQVRTFFKKQQSLGLTQGEAFANIVEWLRVSTLSETTEAPEIVAAFFVQNCEVFD